MLSKMLSKIQNLLSAIKPYAMKATSLAPLPTGIAIGYLGHGPIKLAVDAALSLAKLALHL